jgi:3-hydroxyacyl-[acyl-carrier-protein] dehydratase
MSSNPLQIEFRDLLAYLPHRYPFLLVDRVVAYEPSTMIRGIRNITSSDPFWRTGPKRSYPPGMIIETLGQLAAILHMIVRKGETAEFILGSISDVKIHRGIEEPQQLVVEVWIDKDVDGALMTHGWAEAAEGKVIVVSRMIAAVRHFNTRQVYPQPPG